MRELAVATNLDMLMNHGRDQLILAFTDPSSIGRPAYIAAGLEDHAGGNDPTLTELDLELERAVIGSRVLETTRIRFSAQFAAHAAVGDWLEMGLFDADANTAVLSACDIVGSWTSGNGGYPQPDTSERREGSASLKTVGTHQTSFQILGGLDAYSGTNYTTAARFQLWYYIDVRDKIDGSMTIYLSSHDGEPDDPTQDCYYWNYPTAQVSDGWNFFSRKFSEASGQNGSPDLDNIRNCAVYVTKTESATEYIDRLRLFEEAGNMWARAEFDNAMTKAHGEVWTVYWYIAFSIVG